MTTLNQRSERQRILVLALSALLVFSWRAPVGGIAKAATPELKVAMDANLDGAGHVSIAMKRGYFNTVGLNVKPSLFIDPVDGTRDFILGRFDIRFLHEKSIASALRYSGTVFLVSAVDYGSNMILVWPESGIKTMKDLKGRTIATIRYSTAYVLLVLALESVGLDVRSDIKILNLDGAHAVMESAVEAFAAHKVDVIATSRPFDASIRKAVPNAVSLADDRAFFPNYAIVAGFAAQSSYLKENRGTVKKFTKAWMLANDFLVQNKEESCKIVSEFANTTYEEELARYDAVKFLPSKDWTKYYQDGSINRWLGKTEEIQIRAGVASVRTYRDPKEWVDPTVYLEVFESGITTTQKVEVTVAGTYLYAGLAGAFLATAAIAAYRHFRIRKKTSGRQ